jgi:hypothetical protein
MKVSQYILTTATGFDEQSQIVSVGRKRPMILLGRCSALALVPFLCLLASVAFASTNLSVWVYPGSSRRLIHQPDAQDNHIVDSSGVGYLGGTVPLPNVPVVLTISPVSGDNQPNIQNALDQIVAMTPDANSFRGALLLNASVYPISDSVSINASGIVMRGVGNGTNGTVLYSTSTKGPSTGQNQLQGLVIVSGSYSPIPVNGTSNNIVGNYVPVGARSFTVDGAGVLNVGDRVIVHRPSTADWITAIGMDQLNAPWQPGTVDVDEERGIECEQRDFHMASRRRAGEHDQFHNSESDRQRHAAVERDAKFFNRGESAGETRAWTRPSDQRLLEIECHRAGRAGLFHPRREQPRELDDADREQFCDVAIHLDRW